MVHVPTQSADVGRAENVPINLLRVIAALVVVVGHARTLFLVSRDEAEAGIIQTALYGATALGHQAVIVFFVLSGYWVGGSVVRQVRGHRFGWSGYLVARLTRLWPVVLGALVVTLIFDAAGRGMFPGSTAYAGDDRYVGVVTEGATLGLPALLGNIFFLQDIHVPWYGTNSALWSLSFEFWLYILAPAAAMVVASRGRVRIGYVLLFLALALFVGPKVLLYLPLWGFGAVVAAYQEPIVRFTRRLTRSHLGALRVVAGLGTFGTAVVVRMIELAPGIVGDYIVAIATTFLLATLVTGFEPHSRTDRLLEPVSRLAHSSYSLYAIHTPILVFLVSALGISVTERLPAEPLSWLIIAGLVVGMVALGWLFAQVTEKRTPELRRFVTGRLKKTSRPVLR